MIILLMLVVWFLAYWGGMAATIKIDANRQRAAARAAGGVDFMDRSPVPYMLLGLLCGPLPLLMYFGTTRRTAQGWLLGVGIAVGWSLLFGVLYQLIDAYARHHL